MYAFARFEGYGARRVVAGHADADDGYALRVHFGSRLQIIETGSDGNFIVRPRNNALHIDRRASPGSVDEEKRPTALRGGPAVEVKLLREGVGAADQKDDGPLAGCRIYGMTEVPIVFFLAATDLDDLDGRRVQLCGRVKILLAFEKARLSALQLIAGEEHVGHAVVLVGVEKKLHGGALVA